MNPYEQILSPTTVSALKEKWTHRTTGLIRSSPAIANGVVYVGSHDHTLYVLDASSGKKKWAYRTAGRIYSSPTVANGVVYIGSDDKNLYVFHLL